MRVVWITHNYPRFAGDVSGSFLHPLAVVLRERGVDVRVVAPSDAGQGGREDLDGVPVHRVRYGPAAREHLAYRGTMAEAVRTPAGVLNALRLGRALRRGAQTELAGNASRLSVVHAHWWIPGGLAAPHGVPFVLTSHGTDVRLLDRAALVARVAAPVFRRAHVVTTVSRPLAETIARRTGVTVAADDIQPMPVVDAPRPVTDRRGGVVAVGRLSAQKRWHLALEAFAMLREHLPALTLTLVGDGPERASLERLAAALRIADAVVFAGEVRPSSVPAYLSSAVCCLMPAMHEGFGLAAAEALMQGVPVVVCHDGGGLVDVLAAPLGGRVVEPVAAAIAAGAMEMIGHDAAYAGALGAGAEWRRTLAVDHVADRCLRWYERALHA